MGLFRARPFVVGEVALMGGERCAARIVPAAGRPPGTEPADAVILAAAAAAVAWNRAPEGRLDGLRACLVELARAVAAAGPPPGRSVHLGPLGVQQFLALEPWGPEGRGRVAMEVARARGDRLVPRLADGPAVAGPAVEIAALALIQHAAARAPDAGARLALALAVEGVLAWYREAHQLTAPGDALSYALAHADERMREAGRTPPPGLPG